MTGAQRRTSGVSRGRIHKSHDSWLRARAGLAPFSGARSPLASKAWLSRLIPPNPGLRFPPSTSQPASPISRPFLTHRGPNRAHLRPLASHYGAPAPSAAVDLSQGSLRCVFGAAGCRRLPHIRVLRTLNYISHRPPGHV